MVKFIEHPTFLCLSEASDIALTDGFCGQTAEHSTLGIINIKKLLFNLYKLKSLTVLRFYSFQITVSLFLFLLS